MPLFSFGERVKGYEIPVVNEREVRAGAGILFVAAFTSAMHVWLTGNILYTKLFVVYFFLDFCLRLFVQPRYAPSLILGRLVVSNQTPEYSGAPQKRFAWGLGLIMSGYMLVSLVFLHQMGPLNMLVCLTCLSLLFLETSFGICVGCKIYNLLPGKKAELCPGGVCVLQKKEAIQKTSRGQVMTLLAAALALLMLFLYSERLFQTHVSNASSPNAVSAPSCEAPDWAIKMGHGEIWKQHHGCASE